MSDIAYWDDVYSKEVDALASLVAQLSSYAPGDKSEALAACDAKVSRIRELKQGFTTEKRLIRDKAVRAQYEAKEAEYEQKTQQLVTEIKWARTEGEKAALMAGGRGATEGKTNDDYLNAATKIQDKTDQSLAHTKAMIEATKQVGNATLEELHRQRAQINDITEEVLLIDDNLTRAEKLVRTFGRRMMTDKVIQCFALLNLIALLVLIIYVSVSGKSLTDDGGDKDGPNRRLLRGFDGTEEEW